MQIQPTLGGRADMMQKVKEVYTCLGFSDGPATQDPTQAEQRMSLLKGFTDHGIFFPPTFSEFSTFLLMKFASVS